MWLYYWLGSYGINPFSDVKNIVVPPPQMVANMRVGNMDGFCVGEPWNARAIYDQIGYTVTTTQGIWKDHPEKVLGTTKEFVDKHPNTARALLMAVLEASKHIDTMSNRPKVAEIIAGKSYVNAPIDVVAGRMQGDYEDGLGKQWKDPDYMKFHNDGMVNFPLYSHGIWFLTQHKRWGLLKEDVDYLGVAKQINQVDLYTEVAKALGIAVPASPMKVETLFDAVTFDPAKPADYVSSFKVKS
jgi:nitrate/nitrite transport system substrate-binding protein